MQTEIVSSLADIASSDWDALNCDDNPFTSHAFLSGLETTACVGVGTGWQPLHLLLHDNGDLVGALPMYAKTHSWGEYVFDWAWAEAWQRQGLAYYPKLVVAIPFSPVTGQRLLMKPGRDVTASLIDAAIDYASSHGYSSLHWLFPTARECARLQTHDLQIRHGVQFHWHNAAYADFDEFLATMTSRKRKNIRRERRQVREQGITFATVSGEDLTRDHMDLMYDFYLRTIYLHGSRAYLTREFFHLLAERLADSVVLVLASHHENIIAGALNLRDQHCLYGRYWGCSEDYDKLHFETCYYQAIDYCIATGLSRFEGGAQGEHKLSRGFLPRITCSAHWLANDLMSDSIADFLARERLHVAHYRDLLNEHSPFKKPSAEDSV